MMDFSFTFWGVRGTIPCPLASHMRFGGNTSCVDVRVAGQRIILDAGTGIRLLGKQLLQEGATQATLLLSHTHLDHISGFPFFSPAYRKGFRLNIVSGHLKNDPGIEAVMARQMEVPLFPVPMTTMGGDLRFTEIEAGDTLDLGGGVRVRTAPLNHPDGATGYRIEHGGLALCYITDNEHRPDTPDAALLDLLADADLAICDSTYTDEEYANRVGWGHSTWREAVRTCRMAGVKRMALFHHDPDHDDPAMELIEKEAQALWPRVFAAREGMTVSLL